VNSASEALRGTDPRHVGQLQARFDAGDSFEELIGIAGELGVNVNPADLRRAIAWRQQNGRGARFGATDGQRTAAQALQGRAEQQQVQGPIDDTARALRGRPQPQERQGTSDYGETGWRRDASMYMGGLGERIGLNGQAIHDLTSIGLGLGDFVPGIGEATGTADTVQSINQRDWLGAGINGAATALGVVPFVGDAAGSLLKGMFLGVGARNANMTALRSAEEMAGRGASRGKILRDTGWFKGADGEWRFEISDHPMSVAGREGYLDDVVSHPELFDNYPELGGISVVNADRKGGSYRRAIVDGEIQPGELVIGRQGSPDAQRSIAAHEIQHGIQDIEGFARGGSPSEFSLGIGAKTLNQQDLTDINVLRKLGDEHHGGDVDAAVETFNRLLGREPLRHTVQAAKLRSIFTPDDVAKAADPMGSYRRMAGEVEARNTQHRLNWWPNARRDDAPWSTQDTPDDWQIFRKTGE
jgi:hypothetical protein